MRDVYSAPRSDENDTPHEGSEIERPMYEAKLVGIVSLLGGPVASAYLALQNLELAGRGGLGLRLLLVAIILTVAECYALVWLLDIPAPLFFALHFLQCGIIFMIATRSMATTVQAHVADGGELFAASRAWGISLIVFLIMLTTILIAARVLPFLTRLLLSIFS